MKTAQLNPMYLTRGDTFYQALKFQSDGEPIDLSLNNSIEVDIRKGITRTGKLIIKLVVGDGLTIGGEDNDVLILKVDPETTNDMVGGKYYLDVQIVDSDDNKFTFAWGQIIVRENITE